MSSWPVARERRWAPGREKRGQGCDCASPAGRANLPARRGRAWPGSARTRSRKGGPVSGAGFSPFLGPHSLDDRDRRHPLGRGPALGGLHSHHQPAAHQRRRRLLRGLQGRQRHRGLEAAPGAGGPDTARRGMARPSGQATGAGRSGVRAPRRHRDGRHRARCRRLPEHRPIGAHRRVAAGGQGRATPRTRARWYGRARCRAW